MSDLEILAAAGTLAQNADTASTVPTGPFILEPKLDGWRIIAHIEADSVTYYTRSGNSHPAEQLPHIAKELRANFPADTWLDGEAVAIRIENDKVVNEWATAQSVMTKIGGHAAADRISFLVFDLIAHGGLDARPLSFAKRRELLDRAFDGKLLSSVALVPQTEATDENAAAFVEQGFEGAMVKSLTAPYASNKRGKGWHKIKPQSTCEAVVIGYKEGQNGFTGLVGAIVFGQYDSDGTLVERGRCSGMDLPTRREITCNREKYLGTVIEVAHHGTIGGTRLRHPQFRRFRPDKRANQVLIHDR